MVKWILYFMRRCGTSSSFNFVMAWVILNVVNKDQINFFICSRFSSGTWLWSMSKNERGFWVEHSIEFIVKKDYFEQKQIRYNLKRCLLSSYNFHIKACFFNLDFLSSIWIEVNSTTKVNLNEEYHLLLIGLFGSWLYYPFTCCHLEAIHNSQSDKIRCM